MELIDEETSRTELKPEQAVTVTTSASKPAHWVARRRGPNTDKKDMVRTLREWVLMGEGLGTADHHL
jgi:hypothetical protein